MSPTTGVVVYDITGQRRPFGGTLTGGGALGGVRAADR